MNESLTVVLPVHNAQHTLAARVHAMLDIAGELTNRFEIVIIDDASTDHTEEIACDLARDYPQVVVARHHRQRGIPAAVETGIGATFGTLILIQDQAEPISSGEIRRQWRHQAQSTSGDSLVRPPREASGLMERLTQWGQALREHDGEMPHASRLIRREDYRPSPERAALTGRFGRTDESSPAKPTFLRRVKNFALGE